MMPPMGHAPGDHDDDDDSSWDMVQLRREAHRQRFAELDPKERAELRKLHFMHCPKCGVEIEEITFRGVRIDKCFGCGGVWLDDGELEELAGKPGWFEAMRSLFSR
jgi:uncharacterized protein